MGVTLPFLMAQYLPIITVDMEPELKDIPKYSIGTAAAMIGVSVQTLRLYEHEGLLIIHKTSGNQRLYSDADIERIKCIRHAINEEKISVEGMKRIHGMIPCWDIIRCSDEERRNCSAFTKHTGGCWTYDHHHSVCAATECRLCPVYTKSSDCSSIKEFIIGSTLKQHHEHHKTLL